MSFRYEIRNVKFEDTLSLKKCIVCGYFVQKASDIPKLSESEHELLKTSLYNLNIIWTWASFLEM